MTDELDPVVQRFPHHTEERTGGGGCLSVRVVAVWVVGGRAVSS